MDTIIEAYFWTVVLCVAVAVLGSLLVSLLQTPIGLAIPMVGVAVLIGGLVWLTRD